MALDLCKYYKKQRFVSYDNGQTWQPLDEYERGELYEAHSSDCGGGNFQYRWVLVDGSYICDGKDRYTREVYQYSEDGTVWYNVFPTQYRKATLVERNSPFCDNAGNGQYISGDTEPDSGGTTCPPDYHWNGVECVCDGHQVGDDCIICKGGQQWNGSRCACPAGMNWDSIGKRCYSPSFWTPCDPLKTIKCSNSNGVLTQLDTSYYDSGWAIVNYEVGDCIYRLNDNAFNGQKYMTAITIPSSVIEVGKWVFANCESLLKISFPTSALTELGEYTFNNCSNLTAVTFGGTIPSVLPNSLFANCINLQTASWLQYSNVTSISEKAFYNCYSLNGVTLPQTLQTIGNQAFYCNYTLENIVIPSGVTSIGSSAFTNCSGLTFVNINSNDVSIGNSAFQGCTNLTAATFESSAVTMGNNVFSGCTRLLKLTFNSPTPFEIGEHDFDNTNECAIFVPCQSEQAYKTAWSQYADRIRCNDTGLYYRWVDDNGFYCDGTDEYTRQKQQSTTNGITWTDTGVYRPIDLITHYSKNCNYQGEVALTVVNNDGYTRYFAPCETVIEPITYTAPSKLVETNTDQPQNYTGFHVNQFSGTSAQLGLVSHTFENGSGTIEFDDDVAMIGNYAFRGCNSLTKIHIPNSVISIGTSAFTDCSSLTEINIPDSVTTIGNSAFNNCSSLTSIDIPSGVTSIGNSVFNNCSGLTNMNIPDSVTSIGNSAFNNCSSLTSIDIPDSVTSIGASAFTNCSELKIMYVNAITPPTIGASAFTGDYVIMVKDEAYDSYINNSSWSSYKSRILSPNSDYRALGMRDNGKYVYLECVSSKIERNEIGNRGNIISLNIGNCTTEIGYGALSGMTKVTSLDIPDSVTSIDKYAFENCSGLISVTLGSGVTSIDYGAFRNCTSLTSVTIGSGVTSIGGSAFNGCTSLTSIDIPDSVTTMGDYIFANCTSLTSCTIGSGVTSISTYAFQYCENLLGITINATTPPSLGTYPFSRTNNCPIYVPAESVNTYKTSTSSQTYNSWSYYADRIQPIPN